MRYLVAGLAVLLISVPAMAAAGGPDALSIARRALALAKEKPEVTYVYAESPYLVERDAGLAHYRVSCPRGMVVVSGYTEFGQPVAWSRRRAFANRPANELYDMGPKAGLVATCLEARYVAAGG